MVMAVVLALLACMVSIAIVQARDAARRSDSQNNLKQLALAFANYVDGHETLPPGGIFNAQGKPLHSWSTSLAPYVDGSPWYNHINLQIPWDDPTQLELFKKHSYPVLQNPLVARPQRRDGLPVAHYAVNSWLLHRNSAVRLNDIGHHSETMLAAEIPGDFYPCGMPGNWRDVQAPKGSVADEFGLPDGGEFACVLTNCAVRRINPRIDATVWKRLAGPPAMQPARELTARPLPPNDVSKIPIWKNRWVTEHKTTIVALRAAPDGTTLLANFRWQLTSDDLRFQFKKILRQLDADGPIQHVSVSGKLRLEELRPIADLPYLKRLSLSQAEVIGDMHEFRRTLRRSVTLD